MNILTLFHLRDNDNYVPQGQRGFNLVNKLGSIYSVVTGKFSDVQKPGKNISIDKRMIPFGGKVCFKVYNPDKPDKCGVKSKQNNVALQAVEFKDCRVFQMLSPIHCRTWLKPPWNWPPNH